MKRIAAATTLCVLLGANASAQEAFPDAKDDTFADAKDDKVLEELAKAAEGVEWKASAQAGMVVTTGNARTTTMSGGAHASRKEGNNQVQLDLAAAYVRSALLVFNDANGSGTINDGEFLRDTQTTAQSWAAKLRYDRFLSELDSLFAAGLASADVPANKDLIVGGQVGYSRILVKNDRHTLNAELGYDYSYEKPVNPSDAFSIHSARGFAGYAAKLSEDTGFESSVEALVNVNELDTPAGDIDRFDDTRIFGKLGIVTKLYQDISFRFGFDARYDKSPSPVTPGDLPFADGFLPLAKKLDTKTEASLIINFL